MLKWDHWHIEPSSRCTLRCPRCARAEVPESLLNQDLTLNFFQNQIGVETIKQIRKITFCGNDGDPIYCPELAEICEWIKEHNPSCHLHIITNGSYRKNSWWKKLAGVLNVYDEITWSIDGWDQNSNEQYRVNCDWDSIIAGIKTFSKNNKDTYCTWATIAFRFNEYQLHTIQDLALRMNFDLYQLTKSTKFHSKYPTIYTDGDLLEPRQKDLIAKGHRFERSTVRLSDRPRPGSELKTLFLQRAEDLAKQSTHSGICLIGNKGVFVNSQGEFYPCCWVANRYEHNQSWHSLASTRFNLHNTSFTEIINDPYWQTDFLKFDSLECTTKCTPERLQDREHTTEW